MKTIRPVRPGDAEAIASIYAPYVRETAISFEMEPPDAGEVRKRIAAITERHPYLVLEHEPGRVVAYAYANVWRARPAYRFTAETAVYVDRSAHRRGAGRALMEAVLAELRARGFHRAIAGVTLPNAASVALHEALGFEPVGVFRQVGWKFGAWHDVGFWEAPLAAPAS